MEIHTIAGDKITHFTIKGKVRRYYPNTLIVDQKNILYQHQFYSRIYMRFTRHLYVKTRYGILEGTQSWNNTSLADEQTYRTYKITDRFDSLIEALPSCYRLEDSIFNKDCMEWVVWSEGEGQNQRKYVHETPKTESPRRLPINTPLGCNGQLGEYVTGKSEDQYIQSFETEYTNNLGVKFHIKCKGLYSWIKWIKYKGKIYRAALYHTECFEVLEESGRYVGINYLTKSKYISHMTSEYGIAAKNNHMEMKRLWIIDEQLGGLSVRQYRRLHRKLNKAFKHRSIFIDLFTEEEKDISKEQLDPSLHLYLDEVLRDITEEEKHNMGKIAYENKKKWIKKFERKN